MDNLNGEVWKILGEGDTELTMKNVFGDKVSFDMYKPLGFSEPQKNRKKNFSLFIEKSTKEEGRYELCLRWPDGDGHVVCLERRDGLLIWYDPQSGQYGDRLFTHAEVDFLDRVMKNGIGLRRIDDKIVNRKMFVRLLKKGQVR